MTQTHGSTEPEESPLPEPAGHAPAAKRRRRQRGIQVDAYGIKADVRPAEIGERAPRTWREVRKGVNTALMSLTVNVFRGANDIVLGARKFIRGLAEIPAAVARRVDRAHDRADREEGLQQERHEKKKLPLLDTTNVVAEIEALFEEMRAEGVLVEPHDLGGGRTGILIVPPEVGDTALSLARAALPSPATEGMAGLSVTTMLPPRIAKVLAAAGVRTVGELTVRTPEELLALTGFGKNSLVIVQKVLERQGLKLRAAEVNLTVVSATTFGMGASVTATPPAADPSPENSEANAGPASGPG